MKIIYLLGIGVPSIVIIFFIVLGILDTGFLVEKNSVDSISFTSLFTSSYDSNLGIQVMSINITNDFFMPKKYTLPNLIACLNDKEGVKQRENLELRYNEGKKSSENIKSSYQTVRNIEIETIEIDAYPYQNTRSIEIASHSNKQVEIFLYPKYLYNYQTQISNYQDYDEILLVETKTGKYQYNYCTSLGDKELENAVHIKLDKSSYAPMGESWCNDSDGGENYYVKGTIKGTFKGDNNFEGTDFCSLYNVSTGGEDRVNSCGAYPLNHCSIREYYCCGVGGEKSCSIRENIRATPYTCQNGCSDGACIK